MRRSKCIPGMRIHSLFLCGSVSVLWRLRPRPNETGSIVELTPSLLVTTERAHFGSTELVTCKWRFPMSFLLPIV